MVAFDSAVLRADPARIALGDVVPAVVQAAASQPNPSGPACQASLSGYRTALMFRVLFTSLVFVVSLAAAAALVFAIVRIIQDGVDLAAAVTGVSGVVASGASLFLGRKMNQSITVARQALEDVGTYCGVEVKNQVQGT